MILPRQELVRGMLQKSRSLADHIKRVVDSHISDEDLVALNEELERIDQRIVSLGQLRS